jgi:hypothetical protein
LASRVEVWQAWPLLRLARFDAPSEDDLVKVETVETRRLPNQRGEPPRPRRAESPLTPESIMKDVFSGYVDTSLRPEDVTRANHDRTPLELWALLNLGHDLLALIWGHGVTLVDWHALSIAGAFVYPEQPGTDYLVASPSGRFIAYQTTFHELGLYDRKARQNRVLRAPSSYMHGAAFSPDERWVATGGPFRFGCLWNTISGRLERTLPSPVPFVRVVGEPMDFDAAGCLAGEISADGVTKRRLCPGGGPPMWTRGLPDGEAFLQDLDEPSDSGAFFTQWVSARDGRVLSQWATDTLESYDISSDLRFAVGTGGGSVHALSDGREVWPRRALRLAETSGTSWEMTPDGQLRILGDRARAAERLRCRSAYLVLPFSACTERYECPRADSQHESARATPLPRLSHQTLE